MEPKFQESSVCNWNIDCRVLFGFHSSIRFVSVFANAHACCNNSHNVDFELAVVVGLDWWSISLEREKYKRDGERGINDRRRLYRGQLVISDNVAFPVSLGFDVPPNNRYERLTLFSACKNIRMFQLGSTKFWLEHLFLLWSEITTLFEFANVYGRYDIYYEIGFEWISRKSNGNHLGTSCNLSRG